MTDDAFSMDSAIGSPRHEFQSLVGKMTDRDDFYRQFVGVFAKESRAEMGLAWNCSESPFAPICQIQRDVELQSNIPVSQQRHEELLHRAVNGDTALMVSVPINGAGGDAEQAILIGPVHRRGATELVEFLLPSSNDSATNQSVLRQLVDYCRVAKEFDPQQNLLAQQYHDESQPVVAPAGSLAQDHQESSPPSTEFPRIHQSVPQPVAIGWQAPNDPQHRLSVRQLDEFVSQIHTGFEYGPVAVSVVNELRRILDCDRVTFLSRRGGRYRAEAISGQPSVNRRSNLVTALQKLVAVVLRSNRDFWYPAGVEIPPQIEQPLEDYIDLSMTCSMAVIPVQGQVAADIADSDDGSNLDARTRKDRQEGSDIIGAIVIERASSEWNRAEVEPVVRVVVRHAADAIRNAHEMRKIPLYPFWRAVGQTRLLAAAGNLPKSLLALAAVVAVVLSLVLVKAEHRLSCDGVLRPVRQHRVFAEQNGIVQKIHVQHGSQVEAGDLLITLQNHDLDIEAERLLGELNSLEQRLGGSRSMRIRNRGQEESDQFNQQEIEAQIAGLRLQLETVQRQRQKLRVVAPIDGEILTWDLAHRLGARPVAQGDLLVEVGDTSGQWRLRLELPDRKAGHLFRAVDDSGEPLRVEFALALEPGKEFLGHLSEVAKATSVNADGLHMVQIDVDVDEKELSQLKHSGSTVTAKIRCGPQPLGYVWLHQVWEFIQYKVLFPIS